MLRILTILLAALPCVAMGQRTIKTGELEEARRDCWQQYTASLDSMPQLFTTEWPMLRDGATGVLTLPAALESDKEGNAVSMNYYYGRKDGLSQAAEGQRDGGYPAYIYLHGSGPRQLEWENGLRLGTQFADSPSVYVIPQIPQEGKWYRWYQRSKQWAYDIILRQLLARRDIDPARIYLFGISEGGYGSQRLASFYADYLAAAGPMAGGEPLKNAPAENLRHVAFSLRTGADDKLFYRDILTGYTAAALDSLAADSISGLEFLAEPSASRNKVPSQSQSQGQSQSQSQSPSPYHHWVELIPGRGHYIDYTPTPAWMRRFERTPLPHRFTWEDYEMDEQHRTGFYYLAVDRRPCDTLRTRYDVRIEDNTVYVDVKNVHYTTTETDPQWGIEMSFARTYETATGGQFTLFLDEHLVNLSRRVTVIVNGRRLYRARPRMTREALRRSIALWGDPLRQLPIALTLEY